MAQQKLVILMTGINKYGTRDIGYPYDLYKQIWRNRNWLSL